MKNRKWNIPDIRSKINGFTKSKEEAEIEAIYDVCVNFAKVAKDQHRYRNYKGQLESSVGVVVLKNLKSIKKWTILASVGTDPSLGINDFNSSLPYIVGQNTLPNGIVIPKIGIVGIVFAAAPYSKIVEDRGRRVLLPFAPNASTVFEILKVATK